MDKPKFDINEDAFRPGQAAAYRKIIERIRDGQTYTAIVLPTRYGKTDVMRVSGLRLWRDGFVSNALIVAPNRILRDQAIDPEKYQKCLERYQIYAQPPIPPPFSIENAGHLSWLRTREFFFAALTTSMANNQKEILRQWVDYSRRKHGVPPVIFIDEAHTGSDENEWGDFATKMAEAGAFIVLLTATPYRADRRPIPGFDVTAESVTPVTVSRRSGTSGKVDIYEGNRTRYRLEAHHVTTFRDAWDIESPSPLCKVTCQPFEVELDELDGSTGEFSGGAKVSELSEADAKRVLSRGLKDTKIISDACRILVREIRNRRGDYNATETAGIVFVGNDSPFDQGANQHAEDVKAALRILAPELTCVIATAAMDGAQAFIEGFIKGQGDILIVKQMGGVGLDIARLKVCLDLSNIRTPAAFVQRMTRICTVWERDGGPDEDIRTAVYIVPDDCLSAGLFQQFVIDEGGGTFALTEDLTYLHSIEPASQGERLPTTVFVPKNVATPVTMMDSQQEKASGGMIVTVDEFIERLPAVARIYSKPQVANALADMGFSQKEDDNEVPEQALAPEIRNLTKEHNERRAQVDGAAKSLASKIFRERYGRSYQPGRDGQIYGPIIADVRYRHKSRIGAPNKSPEEMTVEELEAMHRNMTWELQSD